MILLEAVNLWHCEPCGLDFDNHYTLEKYPHASTHWNGNLLCAIDLSTTGTNPRVNDILEIAIIPLMPDYSMNKNLEMFDMKIKPDKVDGWEKGTTKATKATILKAVQHGVESTLAADLFVDWFNKLQLPPRKKIIPLGHNYAALDRPFLQDWLTPSIYEYYFDYQVRDSMLTALAINDICDMRADWVPFPFDRIGLRSMTNRLKIEYELPRDSKMDAMTSAIVYKRLMTYLV